MNLLQNLYGDLCSLWQHIYQKLHSDKNRVFKQPKDWTNKPMKEKRWLKTRFRYKWDTGVWQRPTSEERRWCFYKLTVQTSKQTSFSWLIFFLQSPSFLSLWTAKLLKIVMWLSHLSLPVSPDPASVRPLHLLLPTLLSLQAGNEGPTRSRGDLWPAPPPSLDSPHSLTVSFWLLTASHGNASNTIYMQLTRGLFLKLKRLHLPDVWWHFELNTATDRAQHTAPSSPNHLAN